MRKAYVEKIRLLGPVAGYDYLGAADCHWHRTGYSVGILNEFYELKPGETAADVRRYNGESVLLCDIPPRRSFRCKDSLKVLLYASLYGDRPVTDGKVNWALHGRSGQVFARGQWPVEHVPLGNSACLGEMACSLPNLKTPEKLTLTARLSDASYEIENRWNLWLFPSLAKPEDPRIVHQMDEVAWQRLSRGEALLLLGTAHLPALPYRGLMGGRTVGNAATVIEDHPLLASFPHDGFCDWQFHAMLDGACGVVFEQIPFDPIIEFVSSYKLIVKQAAVFEWQVGAGKLLVCGLNLSESDPAAMFLLNQMLAYMSSECFCPRVHLELEEARRLAGCSSMNYDRDEGQDGNAVALLKG